LLAKKIRKDFSAPKIVTSWTKKIMSLILKIVRSAHCRSMHHCFAMDALKELKTAHSIRLRALLLRHYEAYLEGATAPDRKFKDFENHQIQDHDSHHSGAPAKCREWLDIAKQHLEQAQWHKAAYACGVLSHYFTDPILPLHPTAHLSNGRLYSAMEWSIYESYLIIDQLRASKNINSKFQFSSGRNWVEKAVITAATTANRHRIDLINHYQLADSMTAPSYGLSDHAVKILSELFSMIIDGWAAVLCRLADEVQREIPQVDLSIATALATVDLPLAWSLRRWQHHRGRLSTSRIVKELRHQHSAGEPNFKRIDGTEAFEATTEDSNHSQRQVNPLPPINPLSSRTPNANLSVIKRVAEQLKCDDEALPVVLSLSEARARMNQKILGNQSSSSQAAINRAEPNPAGSGSVGEIPAKTNFRITADLQLILEEGNQLSLHAPIGHSPSIGPKTARRLVALGITRVGHLINADPSATAARLATPWITPGLISQWQAEARLANVLPNLSGTWAELLVYCGITDCAQLSQYQKEELSEQVNELCSSEAGKMILRNSEPPPPSLIELWISIASKASSLDNSAASLNHAS
jgi:hypothetical protein